MKRIKIQKKLQQYEDLKLLNKVSRAHNEDKFQEVLELCKTVIFSEKEEITRANRDFWYLQAVALDSLGRSVDALEIFRRLVAQYPNHPTFLNSFRIICDRIEGQSRKTFDKNPDDPILMKYYDIFNSCWNVPFFLHVAHARTLIRKGHRLQAKEKMLQFLALSPADEDFFQQNLELATEAGDTQWFGQVQALIRRALRKYPSRFELYPLLVTG